MATQKARIGLVGLGYIGRYVCEQLASRPELGLEVAFVHQLAAERLADLLAGIVLPDIRSFAARRPDLVVEMAHPAVTRQFEELFLEGTDYMPLSMTAFADEGLQQRLLETARRCVSNARIRSRASAASSRSTRRSPRLRARKASGA